MRMRRHWITILIALSIPGLLWSQEKPPTKPRRTSSRATPPGATPESARELRIFVPRYQQADQLARIIQVVIPPHEATIAVDAASNKLIVSASPDRMEKIGQVIENLDSPPADEVDAPQMIYRVYMLEVPPKDSGFRPFSIMVTGSSQLPPDRVLTAGKGNDVQIESFHQAAKGNEHHWQFAITGRAASYEPIERLTKSISDCQITELEWEDDTPVMPTTRIPPLPKSLQAHLGTFLGEGTGIVGYWFGNLSVPGTVRAPIGPWVFDMEIERLAQEDQVELEIRVECVSQSGESAWVILGNTIRGHIANPVIIGYNRDNRGLQTMGALVIVPEVSPL